MKLNLGQAAILRTIQVSVGKMLVENPVLSFEMTYSQTDDGGMVLEIEADVVPSGKRAMLLAVPAEANLVYFTATSPTPLFPEWKDPSRKTRHAGVLKADYELRQLEALVIWPFGMQDLPARIEEIP